MTERTIARRYIRALFGLALEQGDVGNVLRDLERLSAKLAQEPAALAALLDPRTGRIAKQALLERLLADATRPLTRDFAAFLVDRGRERILLIAVEELAAMGNEHRGAAVAEVVSAAPLDADARAALVARLAEMTHLTITLDEKVDASLLGGMRVKVGSMLLDASASRRLAGLRDDLLRVALPSR
ncbi:MAG: ATP synthase F1 subunit delta [Planctomycetes bacterium]|nr:ATP synthase F1 subunit delta [Planctomycetota bacterium]